VEEVGIGEDQALPWVGGRIGLGVARQRSTSRRQVGSHGGSGVVGARDKLGARAEGEWEVEGETEGVPLTTNIHIV